MCGIVAAITASDRLPRAVLDRMRDRLAHRGPDGAGSWIDRASETTLVGLAHRRLAILDPSKAAGQPMFGPDRRQVIVYNGEIYNYVELREELAGLGHSFRTQSDTEVLLAAFSQWGEDCLGRLNGMFAFAIWDTRKRRLFVARDRFGEKPVFFAELPGGGIALASEMKALFAHPDIPAEANENKLGQYADHGIDESTPETMFKGVQRLLPAHAMVVDAFGTIKRQWRYWTPDYSRNHEHYDQKGAVEKFRSMLERSIEMRLRSDVPVGSSLSGGLDSSTIVALLAHHRQAGEICTQKTFSARFDADPTLSEGPQIDSVVRRTGVPSFCVTPDPQRLISESAALHWHQEELFGSASGYLQFCVARLAKQNDTIVLLDGQGADELLAGYTPNFKRYQMDLADSGDWQRLWRDTRAFNARAAQASRCYKDSQRRFDGKGALSVPRLMFQRLSRRPRPGGGASRPGVVALGPGTQLRHQMSAALLDSLPFLLRVADRNSMAFGREARFPFLDHELVDWSLSLPNEALISDGWQKAILRRASEGLLPGEIQWRVDKVGYAAPLDAWLRGPMKDWGYENLFVGPVTEAQGYSRRRLTRLWEQHQSGRGNTARKLWRWISLNQWLQLLRDGAWTQREP